MVKSETLPLKATSVKGMAKMYGLSKSFLWKQIYEGRLRAIKIGRRTVIKISDAEEFLASGQPIQPGPREISSSRSSKHTKRLRGSGGQR